MGEPMSDTKAIDRTEDLRLFIKFMERHKPLGEMERFAVALAREKLAQLNSRLTINHVTQITDAMHGKEPRYEEVGPETWDDFADKVDPAGATPDNGSEHPAIREVRKLARQSYACGITDGEMGSRPMLPERISMKAEAEVRKLIEERDGWRSTHRSAHEAYVRATDRAIAAKLRVSELEKERDEALDRSRRMLNNAEDESANAQRLRRLLIDAEMRTERHRMTPEERKHAQWAVTVLEQSEYEMAPLALRAYLNRTDPDAWQSARGAAPRLPGDDMTPEAAIRASRGPLGEADR